MPNRSNGIIVVDKPSDMTSAQLVARIKKLMRVKKAGHTGTLDPFATGVMICCLNQATRLSRFYLHGNKSYEAVLHLGVETDTQDATGTITARSGICIEPTAAPFSEQNLQTIFKQFEGPSEQLPPVYSALKHKGVPLYKLARKGKPHQKAARPIHIFSVEILDIRLPEIQFNVSCSAGTYIRTLCSDIGKTLGCGAHLKELRRTESCGFKIDDAFTLGELEDRVRSGNVETAIISMADALPGMPACVAETRLTQRIKHGQPLSADDLPNLHPTQFEGFVKIVNRHQELLAVIRFDHKTHQYQYCGVFIQ